MSNHENEIEKMLQDEGATAPRLAPIDIDKALEKSHIEYVQHINPNGSVLRWCVITLENGYCVIGDPSLSISVENDRESVGQKVAYENSRRKLWPLLGFAFKDRLHRAKIG